MKKVIKKLLYIMAIATFLVYLFVLFILLFMGNRALFHDESIIEYFLSRMNLIPFKTIGEYVTALFTGRMNWNIPVTNLLGNFLIFLPMGIYIPFFIRKIDTKGRFALIMLTVLLTVEILQLLLMRGAFDIDDLILNLSGAMVGFLIWKTKLVQNMIGKYIDNPKKKS